MREFDRSNVLTLPVMGTALRNQDVVAVAQLRQFRRALRKLIEIPSVAGEQNGKGCQRNFFRRILRHAPERLRIRNDQFRRLAQRGKRRFQFRVLTGYE